MLVGDVVCEVDGLARVLVLEPLVDERAVLERDEKAGPADPGEGEGLFAAAEGGDEAARGHLEVVLAVRILGDGDGEAVGDDDEVLGCAKVHVVWEIGRGVRARGRGRTGGQRGVRHRSSRFALFQAALGAANVVRKESSVSDLFVEAVERPIRPIRPIEAAQRENWGGWRSKGGRWHIAGGRWSCPYLVQAPPKINDVFTIHLPSASLSRSPVPKCHDHPPLSLLFLPRLIPAQRSLQL